MDANIMPAHLLPPPTACSAVLRPLGLALDALDTAASWLICISIAGMVAVVSAQVALRYGFNRSMDWADEISRLFFVWSIFLAIPLGIRARAHIGVEMLVARLPEAMRGMLGRLTALVSAAMLLLIAFESARMCIDQWDEGMASVNASAAWFIVPLAWLGVHGALHLLWAAAFPPAASAPVVLEELG
jgi:TRAP-type C4-dicarboxylate transport system permease small subunit